MSKPQLRTVAHVIEVEGDDDQGRAVKLRCQFDTAYITTWNPDDVNAPVSKITYAQAYWYGIKQAARDER